MACELCETLKEMGIFAPYEKGTLVWWLACKLRQRFHTHPMTTTVLGSEPFVPKKMTEEWLQDRGHVDDTCFCNGQGRKDVRNL